MSKFEGLESPSESALERDIRKGLEQIRNLGPYKPLGYLPTGSLSSYFRSNVEDEIERAKKSSYAFQLFPEAPILGGDGILFVYDRESLQSLLDEHSDVLNEAGWPKDADSFVERVSNEWAPPKTKLKDLVADAFGDKKDIDRTDVK